METLILMIGMLASFALGAWVAKGTPVPKVVHHKEPVVEPTKEQDPLEQMLDVMLKTEAELNASRAKQMAEAMNWNGRPAKEVASDD